MNILLNFLKDHILYSRLFFNDFLQVLAYDEDDGINGEIIYSAKVGKGKIIFHINPETGIIYYSGDLDSGNLYELNVIFLYSF